MTKTMKKLFKEKLPNIMIFVLLDFFIIIFTSFFAIWIRFDFSAIPEEYYINCYRYILIDAIIMYILFFFYHLYTSVWKYASIPELINIVLGCVSFEVLTYLYKLIFSIRMPRSFYLLQLLLMIACVCISRISYRAARSIYINYFEDKTKKKKVMLIGAGDAGRLIIDELRSNKENLNMRIACVIDDNKVKLGSYIKGIKIVGTTKDIEKVANDYNIEDIIIAIPSASKEKINSIVEECHKTKCDIKILPSYYASMNGSPNGKVVDKIRPLSYEDFLGRDQIIVDDQQINDTLENKVVLVTGGGGSIGSELCRQIAKCNPKTLIIFDIYENNAYEIQQELFRDYPQLDLHTIIGSVRDYDRLEKVFKEFTPDYVYHAAAHKHVPLMEVSPNEAIKNNCYGTLNTVKLADKYKAKKFVLISTDKAVRPTNLGYSF